MRGSTVHQIDRLFHESGIDQIGESKHAAKELARENGASTWGEVGREIGVFSYSTADTYRDVWRAAFDYVRETHEVRNVERVSPEHVREYLESRIGQGVSLATFRQEAAALGKMEQALNRYADRFDRGKTYEFQDAISQAREQAKDLDRFEGSRSYADPAALIERIQERDISLGFSARIQLESGGRIHEVERLSGEQLRGIERDPYTNIERGNIAVQGKGGKVYELHVSRETYEALASHLVERGRLEISRGDYYDALREGARESGQDYQSSHGLRWSHAQNRMGELQQTGMSYEQALGVVSKEMGHERSDITEHYLR